jgi:RNA polymerase sigma-70 factor (ECF subfamily)
MDMLQGFFVHVLDNAVIGAADPSRGRFRTFLLRCLRNFVANEYRSLQAGKRGGGVEVTSLDALRDGEGTGFENEPATLADPESAFDQAWARQVVTRAIESVRAEYTARKQGRLFDVLLEKLEDASGSEAYAELATQLGMSQGALRTGASRLRSRLRERIRDEILDTAGNEDVDDEVRHLMRALGGSFRHL